MNKLLILLLFLPSCYSNQKDIALNISTSFKGWVYLVSSNTPTKNEYSVSKQNHGIVYVSKNNFDNHRNVKIKIVETGKFKDELFRSQDCEFYPEHSTEAIVYKKFHFPLTMIEKEDSIFQFKKDGIVERDMGEFNYYYYSGILDTSIIK
jgi:hypothetical protein